MAIGPEQEHIRDLFRQELGEGFEVRTSFDIPWLCNVVRVQAVEGGHMAHIVYLEDNPYWTAERVRRLAGRLKACFEEEGADGA